MKTAKRIRCETTKSRHVRQYGLTVELTKDGETDIEAKGPLSFSEAERSNHRFFTPATCQAIEQILGVNGVVETITRRFEINVTIAPSFNWDDVHEQIIKILRNVYFGGGDVEVETPFQLSAFHPADSFDDVFHKKPTRDCIVGVYPEAVVGVSLCPYCFVMNEVCKPEACQLHSGDVWCPSCNRVSPGPTTMGIVEYLGYRESYRRIISSLSSQLTRNLHIQDEPAFSHARRGGQNHEVWLRRTTPYHNELLFLTLMHDPDHATAPELREPASESAALDSKLWGYGFVRDEAAEESDYRVDDATFVRSWTQRNPQDKTIIRVRLYRQELPAEEM